MLLVNSSTLKYAGLRQLTPVGGALRVAPSGLSYLIQLLGGHEFPQNYDLRFHAPDRQVENVAVWFEDRQGREISVMREIREELVDETGILTCGDLDELTEESSYFARYGGTPAHEEHTTYLIEIFDITASIRVMAKLHNAALRSTDQHIYFATKSNIQNGVMPDGTKIGEISRCLL